MSPGHERPLYSKQLKMRIQKSERLKRNILEINLENEKNADEIDDNTIAKLFQMVGINNSQVEGRQLVPTRMPRKLYNWLKVGVDLNQFCREECYRLTNGVKTGSMKPMDRKEVEVTIKGLNLNTPDRGGQRRTCATCHKTPAACPGGGIARKCDEKVDRKLT